IAERSHAGGSEGGAIGLIAPEEEHLVMDQREHHSAAEYAMAAEHAPDLDRPPAPELVAQITDELRLEIPRRHLRPVIPAEAGIHNNSATLPWTAVCAGMTARESRCPSELREEVVALVVDDDESREIDHFDAPDRFHAELGIFDDLDLLDAILGE